ncbi:MAG TPA: lytic transglycosylase domain-containing protein [Burkholderiales bacterium]|nr:lytic transglycosylase domain-containing protein [Burkholderiales bacterium]
MIDRRHISLRTLGPTAALAALLAAAAPACADVYSFVEEDGTVRFSNQPDDPRYKLYLREPSEYKLRDTKEFRNLRNPGDFRLRAPWGKRPDLLENPALQGKPFQEQVIGAAKDTQLDPALIHAVITAESNYNPNAVSDKGAVGLMQIMPDTARRYGVKDKEIKHPEKNIKAGAQYLADLIRMFDGDLKLALAGYNAGENVVLRYGRRVPPYAETQAYVPRVLRVYDQLRLPGT